MKFTIHPVAYLILLCFEMFLTFQAAEHFTGSKFDKERSMKAQILTIITVFALDILVFKFTKTGMRSLVNMILICGMIKYITQESTIKALIRGMILFVVMIIVDFSVLLISKLIFQGSIMFLMDYFIVMYTVYLISFGTVILVSKKFDIQLIQLNKLKI